MLDGDWRKARKKTADAVNSEAGETAADMRLCILRESECWYCKTACLLVSTTRDDGRHVEETGRRDRRIDGSTGAVVRVLVWAKRGARREKIAETQLLRGASGA